MKRLHVTIAIKRPFLVMGVLELLGFPQLREVVVGHDRVELKCKGAQHDISFSNLKQVMRTEGTLFAALAFDAEPRPMQFSCLSKSSAERVASAIDRQKREWRISWWKSQAEANYPRLARLKEKYDSFTTSRRYLRKRDVDAWAAECGQAVSPYAEIDSEMFEAGIEAFTDLIRVLREMLSNIEEYRRDLNRRFVDNELEASRGFFDLVEGHPLTEEQRRAIVVDESNNLVIAGAGSGKTSVIAAKYRWLTMKGFQKPEEILVLVYAKNARQEMKERLKRLEGAGSETSPMVATFHSLAYAIVGEAEGIMPLVDETSLDERKMRRHILEIISELVEDKEFGQAMTSWLRENFAPYRSEYEFGNRGLYWDYVKEYDLRSLNGDSVKSYEDGVIANFLFLNGVPYEYEAEYEHNTVSKTHGQYVPGFHLPKRGLYIEHFTLDINGETPPYIDSRKYKEELGWKRDVHDKHGTGLIETYSWWKAEGQLASRLEEELSKAGVKMSPLPPRKILKRLSELGMAGPFADKVAEFLKHFKEQNMTEDDLRGRLERRAHTERNKAFVDVFLPIYRRYEEDLKQGNRMDFSDMVRRATEYVESGKYANPYRYILVDEFQDITAGQSRLLKALFGNCNQANGRQMFVAGDDWQSICRFAGSDLSIMFNYPSIYGEAERRNLTRTFRCSFEVAEVARKFVLQNPSQIVKDLIPASDERECGVHVCLADSTTSKAMLVELLSEIDERETERRQAKSVLLLGRYGHHEPDNLAQLKRRFRRLNLEFMTVHGSKGREADYAVVLGMKSGPSGFPSGRQNDTLLDMVQAHSDAHRYAEERRLFYVAMTRARKGVYVLADRTSRSEFVEELTSGGYDVQVRGGAPADEKRCPECKQGRVQQQWDNKAGGRMFIGCSNFPYCLHAEEACSSCYRGQPVWKGGGTMECNICGQKFDSCPRKGCWGWLIEKDGPQGLYQYCSENRRGCDFTRSAHQRLRSKRVKW